MKGYKKELELSQIQMPLLDFLKSYNQNIPKGFPSVSVAILKKFQSTHPLLFKDSDMWSTAKHRKKMIDWLSTH